MKISYSRTLQPRPHMFVHFGVNPVRWSLIFAMAWMHALAWAQVPAPKPASPLPIDPKLAVEEVAATYRSGPIAERITIRVTTAAGPSDRRSVLLHVAKGNDQEPSPRRVHLDLARLEVWLEGTVGRVTNRADRTTYFEFTMFEPVTFDALFRELRPIPLPQLGWCLGESGNRPMGSLLGEVTWTSIQARDAATSEIVGTAASGEVRLTIEDISRRLRAFSARLPRDVTLELTCSPASGAPWTNWSPNLAGRTRVDSLAKLQSTTPTATVGQRLPSIAYITTGYEGWTLPIASDAAPVFVVFVRSGANGEASPALREKTLTLIEAARAHVPPRPEKGAPARVVLVGVLAQGNTQPDELAKNATAWIEAMGDRPLSPVWATAEWSLIAGGHVDAEVLLHVVGAERKLLGTVSCDGACDRGEAETRLREALSPAPLSDSK